MTRRVLFLLVAAGCFLVAGLDAAHAVHLLTPLPFVLFGVSAYIAAAIP